MAKKIRFNYADRKLKLNNKQAMKDSVELLFRREKQPLSGLNYIFCSDDYLLEINKNFLQHDYYTDIITFDLRETNTEFITGEIYISVDRILDNANTLKLSFEEEALRVIFHGALHLCGYKDKTKKQKEVMRAKESFYIKKHLK